MTKQLSIVVVIGAAIGCAIVTLSIHAKEGDAAPKRRPIPAAAELEKSRELARATYADKIKAATTDDAKGRLIAELMRDAADSVQDPPAQFAILQLAREQAINEQSVGSAMDAIQITDDAFEIDASALRLESLGRILDLDTAGKQHRLAAVYAYFYAEKALAKKDVDNCRRFIALALDAANRGHDAKLIGELEARKASIEKQIERPEADVASSATRGPIIESDGPFASRSQGNRRLFEFWFGGSVEGQRAVAAALYWLAHHQSPDGSWSFKDYAKMCKDPTCTGPGGQESLSAATAMGLLPFLGVGQTHSSAGPFQNVIKKGVYWLLTHQKPDGDLSAGADQQMYSHGLAAIALCEDYGMSHDNVVGIAAQKAVNFIIAAQNGKTGGWRYHPGEEGDTSVLGWQFMALKSAQMAGLNVDPAAFNGAKTWLASVNNGANPGAAGGDQGKFSYQPEGGATPPMTAVGLLCSQYLHVARKDPVIVGGVRYLMANQPDEQARNIYYWYYATQAIHNMADKDWETWNGKMQKILVKTQAREGCATGSWDPDKPVRDAWGPIGGRVMMTSLSALTLEVYYRYPPVYVEATPGGALFEEKTK